MSNGMTGVKASELVEIVPGDYLATLRACGGIYETPRGEDGKYIGPLVGYAGTYPVEGGEPKHYVGDVFYNFAMAEMFHHVMNLYALALAGKMTEMPFNVDGFLAAPMGGITFGALLVAELDRLFFFAEKKIIAVATEGAREQSKLVMSRHELPSGGDIVVVEDVTNNFSTTGKVFELIEAAGSRMAGVACILNRSGKTEWEGLPVMSLMDVPAVQYKQDHPTVAAEIESGNVVWQPKKAWAQLTGVEIKVA